NNVPWDATKIPWVGCQANMVFSPDGKYLYLKGNTSSPSDDTAKNLILDATTGKLLLWFEGGHDGIAISPDGKLLAMGNGRSVKLLDIQ
ncbi:MAG TPA: hypothetical protein VK785_08575, partial [Opitutaceae bacterium]|nr:hypothetical protein [Opitutaceae bacterium]